MAHLVEFAVRGLAGGRGVYSQHLNRDVNVFFGKNGSGKTSLLKILNSAMSVDATMLSNVPFRSAKVKIYSILYERAFTEMLSQKKNAKADFVPSDYYADVSAMGYEHYKLLQSVHQPKAQMKWTLRPRKKSNIKWDHQYLPISRLYSNIASLQSLKQATYSEEELDLRFAELIQGLWASYSADVSKGVRQVQERGLAKVLRAVLSKSRNKKKSAATIDSVSAYRIVSAFLKRQPGFSTVLSSEGAFTRRYSADPQLQSVVKDINEVEHKIELATAPREDFRKLIESMFIGNKSVKLGEKGIEVGVGSKSIGLPRLSSGEKQLLLLFVATLLAGQNTIIIDEPELSMHVDWQKILVKSMMRLNPNAQLVIATHSPEIMADLPDSKIFRL